MLPCRPRLHALVPTLSLLVLVHLGHAEDAPPAPQPPPKAQDDSSTNTITVIGNLDKARNQISPSLGATTYQVTQVQLSAEAQGDDASFNQVLLRTPGMAQDQYSQLHLRGEHANIQYRINDVLLPEGITTFGQEIDTRFAQNVTLITGSLPAQYGLRTAGVVDISTKTGATEPGGEVSLYGGSFDTIHTSVSYGGTFGDWDVYATGSELHNHLGIDNPTSSTTAIHDESDQYRGFLYLSRLIDPTSRISLIASGSDNRFQIPDLQGQAPGFTLAGEPAVSSTSLDERQIERTSYLVVAYQKSIGAADIQLAPFMRESNVEYTPDYAGDLEYNGVAGSLDRHAFTSGIQADSSLSVSKDHTMRAGASYSQTKATIDTSTAVFPGSVTDVDGNPVPNQASTAPETIVDNNSKTGSFTSFYCQDEWKLSASWTVNFGARFDSVIAYVNQDQISPRINTTYQLTSSTTLHAGYSRYFTPPPLEAISQETVNVFNGTTNAALVTQNSPVEAERANYFDVGITQKIGDNFQVGLDGYYKNSNDQLDEGQFGTAVVLSPFNYRYGRIMGTELTTTYQEHAWTCYANAAVSEAQGKDIDSAQFLFTQEELDYAKNNWIFLDHDQRVSISAGVSYLFPSKTRVSLDGIFGTGLRNGFDNTTHLPSYGTANIGISQEFQNFTARLDIENIFDKIYQIRDGSGVGVFAPSYGPRRGIYGGLKYDF
jgi:outer membrane receptor protein involved in Fe transport